MITTKTYIDHFDKNMESHSIAAAARKALSKVDFPSKKMEDWKYLNFKSILDNTYSKQSGEVKQYKSDYEYKMELVNGNEINSSMPGGLSKIANEKISAYIKTHKMDALALLSLSTSKAIISYEVSKDLQEPIHMLSESQNATDTGLSSKIVIFHIKEGAKLNLNSFNHGEKNTFTNDHFIFYLEKSAKLNLVNLFEGDEAIFYNKTQIFCEEGATVNVNQVQTGASLQKAECQVDINGENVEANVSGLYILNKKQKIENFVRINHNSPNSVSNQNFKGILDDQARAIFDGKIFVAHGADGTDATQLNKSLLLSSGAEVDTKPQLEIYADDVKCNHGATVSRFEENEIFYFLSRGIDRAAATELLAKGFLIDTVSNLEDKKTKSFLVGRILNKINKVKFEN